MMFVKEFIVRLQDGKNRTVFFWENIEGALTDKTNAFGCFLAGLLGLEEPINVKSGLPQEWPMVKKEMLHGVFSV